MCTAFMCCFKKKQVGVSPNKSQSCISESSAGVGPWELYISVAWHSSVLLLILLWSFFPNRRCILPENSHTCGWSQLGAWRDFFNGISQTLRGWKKKNNSLTVGKFLLFMEVRNMENNWSWSRKRSLKTALLPPGAAWKPPPGTLSCLGLSLGEMHSKGLLPQTLH